MGIGPVSGVGVKSAFLSHFQRMRSLRDNYHLVFASCPAVNGPFCVPALFDDRQLVLGTSEVD